LSRALGLVAIALLVIALTPADALAWSPGTHILLGEAVLGSASALLPAGLAALLRAHARDFLYGSIAADTSFAKRYARIGRHCHYWHVGEEILDRARDEPLQAFAWSPPTSSRTTTSCRTSWRSRRVRRAPATPTGRAGSRCTQGTSGPGAPAT
jgi:hypothetical protein